MLQIKEIFYTLQGEGTNCGMPAVFCRTGECNLRCSFCDTDFLTDLKDQSVEEVAEEIKRVGGSCKTVVFTGGEPLIHQNRLAEVMGLLRLESDEWYFCVETNGTIAMQAPFRQQIDFVCLSPKIKEKYLLIREADEVKVVFTEPYNDLASLKDYGAKIQARRYYVSPKALPNNPYSGAFVDVMHRAYPEHTNYEACIQFVKENPKWRLNLQTHKILNIR